MEKQATRDALLNRYVAYQEPDKRGEWLDEDDRTEMKELFKVLFRTPKGRVRALTKQVEILEWLKLHPLWQISLAAGKFFKNEVTENPRISPPYERYFFGILRRCDGEYTLMKQERRDELEGQEEGKPDQGDAPHKRPDPGVHTVGDLLPDVFPVRRRTDK